MRSAFFFVVSVVVVFLASRFAQPHERTLERVAGEGYWGAFVGPPTPVEKESVPATCCIQEPECVRDREDNCTSYASAVCAAGNATGYHKFSVANRTKCSGNYASADPCSQTTSHNNQEHWQKCAEIDICKWDDVLWQCLIDYQTPVLVPITCEQDFAECPH